MDRKRYSSDLQVPDWQYIEPLICTVRASKWPLLEVVNGILYWLKNDCLWQDLPGDFPPWYTVSYYFKKWYADGTLSRIGDYLTRHYGERAPHLKRRKKATTKVVIDLGWMKHKATTPPCARNPDAATQSLWGAINYRTQ